MQSLKYWWVGSLLVLMPVLGVASVIPIQSRGAYGPSSLAMREQRLWTSAIHDSEFATMVHTASRASCGEARPPQALATPDPLLEEAPSNSKVSVSFIVGTDGRVHSPLILESANPNEDRTVLDAVRYWRYRPALCNGVPTDAEAKIEFSSRQVW
jgi:TonB family protein